MFDFVPRQKFCGISLDLPTVERFMFSKRLKSYATLDISNIVFFMRHFFSSFCRLIAYILAVTVLTSGIAMAAYVCPELTKPAMPEMMEGMPCAEMDEENPIQCAKAQAGDELALEQLAAPPVLTPSKISFVMPVMAPVVPLFLTVFWPESAPDPGSDPPYLRTQRLRI